MTMQWKLFVLTKTTNVGSLTLSLITMYNLLYSVLIKHLQDIHGIVLWVQNLLTTPLPFSSKLSLLGATYID
jgi:hypothetical protein